MKYIVNPVISYIDRPPLLVLVANSQRSLRITWIRTAASIIPPFLAIRHAAWLTVTSRMHRRECRVLVIVVKGFGEVIWIVHPGVRVNCIIEVHVVLVTSQPLRLVNTIISGDRNPARSPLRASRAPRLVATASRRAGLLIIIMLHVYIWTDDPSDKPTPLIVLGIDNATVS